MTQFQLEEIERLTALAAHLEEKLQSSPEERETTEHDLDIVKQTLNEIWEEIR